VAFAALIVAFMAGVVPADRVFAGFGHPAVVIIALVLIVSRGLSRSGAIELLARRVIDASRGLQAHIGIMSGVAAALSSLMNNVAALALLMPIDMQAARRAKRSPALTLMPLSFASILGGMVTALGAPYSMFDFAPVGAVVAVAGVLFVAAIGWRLIPVERGKKDAAQDLQDLEGYIAEAKVPEKSDAIGKPLRELEPAADENDITLLGLVRLGKRLPGTARGVEVKKGDMVVFEGSPEAIDQFAGAVKLKLGGSEKNEGLTGDDVDVVEVVVPEGARIAGLSAMDLRLQYRQGVTLLGISRRGVRFRERVRRARIEPGDVLLLLGPEEQMPDVVAWLGCLPLAERGIGITQRNKAWLATALFAAAIGAASFGLVYLPLALASVVVAFLLLRIVPLSEVYDAIEWPVIVLLGSMIPIGAALEASGGTAIVAESIVDWTAGLPAVAVLTILMIVTMTLSDVLNNVATALIAAPIGIDIANRLGANPDEQHHHHGPRRLQVRRLLASRAAARASGRGGERADDPGGLAAVRPDAAPSGRGPISGSRHI
jgi:di/tricarboxylate transporter